MKRLLVVFVAFAAPLVAHAQMPQPTIADARQAVADTTAEITGDLNKSMVNLRAQLYADMREIASLQAQLAEAKKPVGSPAAPPVIGKGAAPGATPKGE